MSALADAPVISLPIAGDRIAGKYRIERLLGKGGMGAVYLAEHEMLHQKVAIKFLLPEIAEDPELASRFLNEGRAVARIRSEHVASVFDADVDTNGAAFLVLEYLDGTSLDDELLERGRIPPDETIHYALEALEALAQAHALGIVHRDIKPSNLFLVRRPDGSRIVKLLDFGISKVRTDQYEGMQTAPNTVLGSPLFMAPEQVRDAASVDMRADIWSMGVILFRMLAGVLPFGGPNMAAAFAAIFTDPPGSVRDHVPVIPEELERVVLKCLQKTPAGRFQDVGELARALSPFAPGTDALTSRIIRILDRARPVRSGGTDTLASPEPRLIAGAPASPNEKPVRVSTVNVDSAVRYVSKVPTHSEAKGPPPLVSPFAIFSILVMAILAVAFGFWWLDQEDVALPVKAAAEVQQ